MQHLLRTTAAVLATLSMMSFARSAVADEARTLFEAGVRASRAGNTTGACTLFERSYIAGPALGSLLNVAGCEEMRGELVAAYNDFVTALAWAKRDAKADRAEAASVRLAALAPAVARIVVRNPSATRDLRLDNRGAPELAEPVAVEPGAHVVSGRHAATGAAWSEQRQVNVGMLAEITVSTVSGATDHATRTTRTTAAEVPAPRSNASRTWAYVALGVGTTALAAGAVTGALAIGKTADARTSREANHSTDASDRDAEARRLVMVATISGLAGAVLATLGVVILRKQPSPSTAVAAARSRVEAAPMGTGLALRGAF